MTIFPAILCGGTGSRLWPLSRAQYPKQFLPLVTDRTMLQETVARVAGGGLAPPIMICNTDHRFLVAEQLREISVAPHEIVLEPVARSTAPAACVAALLALQQDKAAQLLLLPSDHVIADEKAFRHAVSVAAEAAGQGYFVTFGMSAKNPETGYGYIKRGESLDAIPGVWQVERFVEKPDMANAEKFVSDGGYDWNSGMFLFGAEAYVDELRRLAPDMVTACENALAAGQRDLDFLRLDDESFGACPQGSIDVTVMEQTERAAVVPVELGWSDVGAWPALWELAADDMSSNVLSGQVTVEDVEGSYLRSEGPMVAAIGVRDLVVVATADAVLITPKDRAFDVKGVVDHLKREGRVECDSHLKVHRPWGWSQGIDIGDGFQVKRICVNPGHRLSLQYHNKRAEHWVVVSGTARVTRGDDVFDLQVNQSTYIPIGEKHRLENPADEPLHLIEVQSGDYLGEDDIVRLEDDFARHDG